MYIHACCFASVSYICVRLSERTSARRRLIYYSFSCCCRCLSKLNCFRSSTKPKQKKLTHSHTDTTENKTWFTFKGNTTVVPRELVWPKRQGVLVCESRYAELWSWFCFSIERTHSFLRTPKNIAGAAAGWLILSLPVLLSCAFASMPTRTNECVSVSISRSIRTRGAGCFAIFAATVCNSWTIHVHIVL